MLDYLKTFITRPKKLYRAKRLSFWQSFGLVLIILVITLLPIFTQLLRSYQELSPSLADIQSKIPDFEIQNGEMLLEEDVNSFIYEIDSALFVFDPHGEVDRETLNKNLDNGYLMAGGFLEDELYVVNHLNEISLPYQAVEGLDQSIFSRSFFIQFVIILSLVLTLSTFIAVLAASLFTALFVKLITLINGYKYTFGQIWKIVLAAFLIPGLLALVLTLFNFNSLFFNSIIRIIPIFLAVYSIFHDPEKNSRWTQL